MSGAYEARMEAGREVMMGEAQTMFDDGFFDEEIKDLILGGDFDKETVKRAKQLGFDNCEYCEREETEDSYHDSKGKI